MSNEFRVCDDCQAVNLKTLIPRLKRLTRMPRLRLAANRIADQAGKRPLRS